MLTLPAKPPHRVRSLGCLLPGCAEARRPINGRTAPDARARKNDDRSIVCSDDTLFGGSVRGVAVGASTRLSLLFRKKQKNGGLRALATTFMSRSARTEASPSQKLSTAPRRIMAALLQAKPMRATT